MIQYINFHQTFFSSFHSQLNLVNSFSFDQWNKRKTINISANSEFGKHLVNTYINLLSYDLLVKAYVNTYIHTKFDYFPF